MGLFSRRLAGWLLVFLVATNARAAGTWRWLAPSGPAGATNLSDVAFADASKGFAVGAGGTVLRTGDAGRTWESLNAGATQDLRAVTASGTTVVAVGNGATIIRSQDGGGTFATIAWPVSSSRPNLVDVQLVDGQNGFAVGEDGTFVATTDGFATVTSRSRITFATPAALWFSSATQGWAVGATQGIGLVLQTTDGGRSFSPVHRHTTPFLAISGATLVIPGAARPVLFAAGGSGTSGNLSVFSPDATGSFTWQDRTIPGGEIVSVAARAVASASTDVEVWGASADGLWVARASNQTPLLLRTQSRPRLRSVASPVEGAAIAVGEGGSIVNAQRAVGAATVVSGSESRTHKAGAVSPGDSAGATLGGTNGASGELSTATLTSTSATIPNSLATTAAVVSIALAPGGGLAALANGDILGTLAPNGTGWARVSTATFGPTRLALVDGKSGYGAGLNGLFRTIDGGRNWTQAVPNVAPFVDVQVNGTSAIAASPDAVWTRAGTAVDAAWTKLALPPTSSPVTINRVGITSAGLIVVAGRIGATPTIAARAPGTAQWNTLTLPVNVVDLVVAADRVFVLGTGGTLAEYANNAIIDVFQSRADLRGLAVRTRTDASGRAVAAPLAYGDFGALLGYEDASSPVPPNQPPIVVVTTPQVTLDPGQITKIEAQGRDPEGQPLTYTWSDPNAAGLSFAQPGLATTEVKWATSVPAGTRAVARVTVCDPQGACTSADVIVATTAANTTNQPPVVVVTGTATTTGQPARLDASRSSDPDGDPLLYTWNQISGTPAQVQGGLTGPTLLVDAPAAPGVLVFELRVCDPQGACARTEVSIVVSSPTQNSAPVAATKGDLVVDDGATFDLDASDSFDPEDGGAASFAWRQLSGPTRTITGDRLSIARVTAGAAGETYRFAVRVCDLQNACTEAGINVEVRAGSGANKPPVVTMNRPGQFVNVGDRVTISATVTDPEGQPVSGRWTDLQPAYGLSLTQTGPFEATFTVTPAASGLTLAFILEACDASGACTKAPETVTVGGGAQLVADAGPDQTVAQGDSVTLDASNSRGGATLFHWEQTSGVTVALTGQETARATFTAPRSGGDLVFTLTVASADGRTANDTVTVTVTGPALPIATIQAPSRVGWGARVQLDGRTSRDPQGRPLTFRWTGPQGFSLAGADGPLALFYAPVSDTRLDFTLEVCAAPDECGTGDVSIRVDRDANLPPIPEAGPDRRAQAGSTLVLDGTLSTDPERGRLTALWSTTATDVTLAAPASLWSQVTLPEVAATTRITFLLQVCDPEGACGVDTLDVEVLPNGPEVPVISASIKDSPDGTVDEASTFEVLITATCPGAPCRDRGQLRLVRGPTLVRTSRSQWLYATPTVARATPFSFEAEVCDTADRCAVTTLDGTIRNSVNEPPVAITGRDQSVARREAVVLDASPSYDPNGDAITMRWQQLSGTPEVTLTDGAAMRPRFIVPADATPGELVFELEVCDEAAACAKATTTVTITDAPPANRAPIAIVTAPAFGLFGTRVPLDATRSFDPDDDALTFQWTLAEGANAVLEDDTAAVATLVPSPLANDGDVIAISLEVCDALGACTSEEAAIELHAPAADDAVGSVTLGPDAISCGCAGEPTSIVALSALALLLRRRKIR